MKRPKKARDAVNSQHTGHSRVPSDSVFYLAKLRRIVRAAGRCFVEVQVNGAPVAGKCPHGAQARKPRVQLGL